VSMYLYNYIYFTSFRNSELAMVEAPPGLVASLDTQAGTNWVVIVYDESVELRRQFGKYPDATFLIWWPHVSHRSHTFVTKKIVAGCV